MGKNKAKGDGGMKKPQNVNTVPNRDIMQRMNFLWQASVYLESLGGGGSGCGVMKEEEVGEEERGLVEKKKNIPNVTRKGVGRKRKWKMVDGPDLARVYIRTMKSVGQKTTTKMYVVLFCFDMLADLVFV
jgi:ribonuclease P protein subunit RPR2